MTWYNHPDDCEDCETCGPHGRKFHVETDRRTQRIFRFKRESDNKLLERLDKYIRKLRRRYTD